MTETEVKALAEEKHEVKGYNVYLVDTGDKYYGYSRIVYKDEQIKYLNDYAGRHLKDTSKDELKKMYLENIENQIFTDEELAAPLKNYDEYRAKSDFLHNHYGMQKPHVSIFQIFHSDEEEKEYDLRRRYF